MGYYFNLLGITKKVLNLFGMASNNTKCSWNDTTAFSPRQVWFQNRRAKWRKSERFQQPENKDASDNSLPEASIVFETIDGMEEDEEPDVGSDDDDKSVVLHQLHQARLEEPAKTGTDQQHFGSHDGIPEKLVEKPEVASSEQNVNNQSSSSSSSIAEKQFAFDQTSESFHNSTSGRGGVASIHQLLSFDTDKGHVFKSGLSPSSLSGPTLLTDFRSASPLIGSGSKHMDRSQFFGSFGPPPTVGLPHSLFPASPLLSDVMDQMSRMRSSLIGQLDL